jgi:hypothetical protein
MLESAKEGQAKDSVMKSLQSALLLILSVAVLPPTNAQVTRVSMSGRDSARQLALIKTQTNAYIPWAAQRHFLRRPIQYRRVLSGLELETPETFVCVLDLYINRVTGLVLATEVAEAPNREVGELLRSEVSKWAFLPEEVKTNQMVKVTVAFYFSRLATGSLEIEVAQ